MQVAIPFDKRYGAGVSVSKEISDVEYEILTYMAKHPDAQDTLEGIVQWWLLERNIEHQSALVKKVLNDLARKGLILENRNRDERLRYQVNRNRLEEIWKLIKPTE